MNKLRFGNLERVTKTTARKLYENGGAVYFCPVKLNPQSTFGLGMWQSQDAWGQYESFDKLCNNYSWYNCTAETGKYIAFYREVS